MNLIEEWNFNIETDRLPNRDLLKPNGYGKLTLLDTQYGKKIDEADLVKHGLSLASLAPQKGKMKAKRPLAKLGRYSNHPVA